MVEAKVCGCWQEGWDLYGLCYRFLLVVDELTYATWPDLLARIQLYDASATPHVNKC